MLNLSTLWDQHGSTQGFLAWVKRNVAQGFPVTIAVYENMWVFEGHESGGDADYDHIVPVVGIVSQDPSEGYLDEDMITFSDNGLYTPDDDKPPPYIYTAKFSDFARTRKEANKKSAPTYSLPSKKQYGIAITGAQDSDGTTLPVRVETNKNFKQPDSKDGSGKRPKGQGPSADGHGVGPDPGAEL